MERLKALWLEVRLTWRLLRDPRVPMWSKAIPVAAAIYVISPIDLIPGFILLLGQLDDLAIFVLGMRAFQHFAPDEVVAEHRAALEQRDTGEVIDAPRYSIRRSE
jgi:uncharacterized membrane protein YkvA (DUF1232 family)